MYIGFFEKGVGIVDFLKLQVGFKEIFNTDKTYKSAEVTIINKEPIRNIERNDVVVLTQDTNLEYDQSGIPTNHRQYLVDVVESMTIAGLFQVKLVLKDLIEYFKGFQTTNLSFTNQISKTFNNDVTFLKEEYNYYTAFKRLLEITPTNNDDLTALGFWKSNSLIHRVTLLDREFLSSINFADETLTASDLFTILFSYDDTLDRMPAAYIDVTVEGNNLMPEFVAQESEYLLPLKAGTLELEENLYTDFNFQRAGAPFFAGGLKLKEADETVLGQYYYNFNENNLYRYSVIPNFDNSGPKIDYINDTLFLFTTREVFTSAVSTETKITDLNRLRFLLKFERRDGYDKERLSYNEFVTKKLSFSETKSSENYANAVISDVENLHPNTNVVFPQQNLWLAPQYNSSERTIPTSEDAQRGNWFIELPVPIKRITAISVMRILATSQIQGDLFERETTEVDLKYVLENKEYITSGFYANPVERNKIYHFTEGDTKLWINPYISDSSDNQTYIYNITYVPLISTVLHAGEGDYAFSVNQINSQYDSLKQSNFLNTYLKSMQASDIVFSKRYDNIEEFIGLVGSRVAVDELPENDYIITNMGYINANTKFIVSFQLNKTHWKRNLNVKASERITPDKSISYENMQNRKEYVKDIVKFGLSPIENSHLKMLSDKKLLLLSSLVPGSITEDTCQLVAFRPYSTLLREGGGTSFWEKGYLLNTPIKQINKNQVQYNCIINSNALIGWRKSASGALPNDIVSQEPYLYTDPFGEVDKIDFQFTFIDNKPYYDVYEKGPETTRTSWLYAFAQDYPTEITAETINPLDNTLFKIENVNFKKDMLEKLNYAFIFELKGEGIIVCDDLLRLSRLIQPSDNHTLKVFGFNKMKSELDSLSENIFELSATSQYDNEKITISFNGQNTENLKSIIIATDNNKKLLILNNISGIIENINSGFINIYF